MEFSQSDCRMVSYQLSVDVQCLNWRANRYQLPSFFSLFREDTSIYYSSPLESGENPVISIFQGEHSTLKSTKCVASLFYQKCLMSSLGIIFIDDNVYILFFVIGTASNCIMLQTLYIWKITAQLLFVLENIQAFIQQH